MIQALRKNETYLKAEGTFLAVARNVLSLNGLYYGGAYLGVALAFNAARAIDVYFDTDDTRERSAAAYLAQTVGYDTEITVRLEDVRSAVDNRNEVTFTDDAYTAIADRHKEAKVLRGSWDDAIENVVEHVRDEGNDFSWLPFEGWGSDGARLMEVADRYHLALLPVTAEHPGPEIVVTEGSGSGQYEAVFYMNTQWSEELNTQILREFLKRLDALEGSKTNIAGSHTIERIPGSDEFTLRSP